jgi:hypothetical protein
MAAPEVCPAGPAVAYDEGTPVADGAIVVHAAVPVTDRDSADHGLTVVDLPQVDSAAAIIHHGSMDDVLATGQAQPAGDLPHRPQPGA